MKKITRKKHLEMRLQAIPSHPKPKVGLEQYTTPSVIASDLIWNAYALDDIEGMNVEISGYDTDITSAYVVDETITEVSKYY